MAKRNKKQSDILGIRRTVYCSGPNWEGNGSKTSSTCPFHHSMDTMAIRYKCHNCSAKRDPDQILADENGITKEGRIEV